MIRSTLQLFKDTSDGKYKVAHSKSIGEAPLFKSDWDPQGIFYQAFEHYFERTHPSFKDEASYNMGGKIAATGHHYYFMDTLWYCKITNIKLADKPLLPNAIVDSIQYDIYPAIAFGKCQFGKELHCMVPGQEPNTEIDPLIQKHWLLIIKTKISTVDKAAREAALKYKESINLDKLKNLYRWGYHQASKMVPDTPANTQNLHHFYTVATGITRFDPEELIQKYHHIDFTIEGGPQMQWSAHFVQHDGTKVDWCDLA